jgi:Domain of unknown function (DUF4082)
VRQPERRAGCVAAITLGGWAISTYRLFPETDGPDSPVSYDGPFMAGIQFEVTTDGMWFEGFWWWVCPSGQPTSSQQFALWNVTGEGIGTVIPGSMTTSGELTAGQWNWVPLSAPVQLAIGTSYNACTGFTGGFPNTNDQFGAGGPFAAGIVNGPLSAYSDADGSLPPLYDMPQGVFGTA